MATIAEKLKLIADNEQLVFNAGKAKGHELGYSEGHGVGYEEGKQAEHDAFWDVAQQYGRQKYFMSCFGGHIWTTENFKPKYDIVNPKNCIYMFYYNRMEIDLVEHLNSVGRKIIINEDNNCSWSSAFAYAQFKRIGKIYSNGTSSWSSTFLAAQKLETIDEVGNYSGGEVYFDASSFRQCDSLKNIRIKGVIVNPTSFQWSTLLTRASIESIVSHLSDTATGKTLTLSKAAVDKAFETSEGANDGVSSQEWDRLEGYKPNWEIALV